MLKKFQLSIFPILFITFSFADVLMTELTDPQNSSDAGRYVELYNNGDSDVDFSTGWLIQRWTNGNADPSTPKELTGIILAGGFYIVCNDDVKFSATFAGITCDQNIGTGGPADSNGDDNLALIDDSGAIVDMFGVAGEDGSGTGHEFEDGRAERADSNISASATWDEAGWNIDNDSGGGDGNQYAPEGFDPGAWIGASSGDDGGGSDTCDDESACNTGSEGDCAYPETNEDCDGNCIAELDCAGNCGGDTIIDCNEECGGAAVVDSCGECGGDGSTCSVDVTFSVDMNIEGVTGDIKLRTSTENGEYMPSDWYTMTDNGDGTYSYTLSLVSGVEYGYNFNNSDGAGYESGDGLTGCGGGNYGNDRFVTPGDTDITLDVVCWEACEACPEDIPGCTDSEALNYDPSATVDDGSCMSDWPEVANLFFSEVAEGSSNNKYLEIYNATDGDVDLSGYSLSSCSNGCDDGLSWDYPDNVTFDSGATVGAGDVYVVCHGSADDLIQAECNQTFTYLSNGDDVFGLTQVGSGVLLDIIGTIGEDPGSGWEVSGVGDTDITENATKDHTLVRDASIVSGNGGDWATSAASEWLIFDQNTWDYVGSHPHEFESPCSPGNVNEDDIINVLDVVSIVSAILENATYNECADYNVDGAVNVLDVVAIVGIILGNRTSDATEAGLIKAGNALNLTADGYIGGVQMTLSHGSNFSIELTDKAMVADYRTNGNETTLIIVAPESDALFIATGEYEVIDIIVANSAGQMDVSSVPSSFVLSDAYPNPFNPSTSINLSIPESGHVSVMVYNVMGQLVSTLADGYMNASDYSFTWNANDNPSGVYLIRAEMNSATSVQKVILLK